jgi:integrase
LFATERGTPMNATHYLVYIFNRVKKDTAITKGFHSFRHTHASELLAAGVPIVDVSRRLGHARVSTTLDVYGHLIASSEDKVTNTVTNLLNAKKQA